MREVLRILAVGPGDAFDGVNIPGKGSGASWADNILDRGITWVFISLGIVGVIILIYGGIQMILAQGDSGKTQQARQTIVYAVIGIIVVLLAGAIVSFVISAVSGAPE